MTYTLPALPYAYDALEPHIDAQTMEIHYTKHHQTYINNLNAAVEGTEFAGWPVEKLVSSVQQLPEKLRAAVINQGGGHAQPFVVLAAMSPKGEVNRRVRWARRLTSNWVASTASRKRSRRRP